MKTAALTKRFKIVNVAFLTILSESKVEYFCFNDSEQACMDSTNPRP